MAKKAAHHGGAWKVAYADFVTAMMALFMVLWISKQDSKVLVATSTYFKQPFLSIMDNHGGVMPFPKDQPDNPDSGRAGPANAGKDKSASAARKIELNFLNALALDFRRQLRVDNELDQKPIDIQVTSDGLRITLFDRARQPLFAERTAELTPWGRFALQNLAWLIDRHRFKVAIDGHTRAHLALPQENYSAWELSTDRANAARRSLVRYAVEPAAIERVTGYADTQPLDAADRDAESNQRITVSLKVAEMSRAEGKVVPVTTAPLSLSTRPPIPSLQ